MRKSILVGTAATLLVIALMQASPTSAGSVIDCQQACVRVYNNSGGDIETDIALKVDGVTVWQVTGVNIPNNWTWPWGDVNPCMTWADDGDGLTYDLGYGVHTVTVEATGLATRVFELGPCAEPPGGQGCTPGYWKNHEDAWPATGFALGDDFDSTFGVFLFNPDITLFEAVWARGGRNNKLARHGTAALLSAAHPGVTYSYSVEEVIALVQVGNAEALVEANEQFCPLD